ncbi:MAG: cytochrome-c peroxidase, partial [Saprospiraceae bacterium]|nr:cytochrome-c peroxidase [Candidatus Vicinibacter affinis]
MRAHPKEHNEFDFNIVRIAERLNNNQVYAALSMETYGSKPDPFVITRSIAAFER